MDWHQVSLDINPTSTWIKYVCSLELVYIKIANKNIQLRTSLGNKKTVVSNGKDE